MENGKYVTRHEWFADLWDAGFWWVSGRARLTEEGEFTAGLSAFDALTPLWGGAAFVAFTETAWVFYERDWVKTDGDGYAANVNVEPVVTVPYPVVPDAVVPTDGLESTLLRDEEKYTAGGFGKVDAGTNSVVVGPVVVSGGELLLLVLQARQSGKRQSASVSLSSFLHGNRFSLPLTPPDEPYPLVAYEEEGHGLYPARIMYSVSNPLWRRVSAGRSVSLTAAVELGVEVPHGGEESAGLGHYLSVVSQTLGTGVPWMFVDVLPSSGVTDEVDVVFTAVGVAGVDESVVGGPVVGSAAVVGVAGVGGSVVVGVPSVRVGSGVGLVVGGVAGGGVGLPVTLDRQVLRPAGVRGAVGGVSLAAAVVTVPAGVGEPVVGGVSLSGVSPVVPGGVDGSVVGEAIAGSVVVLDVAGRVPPRMGRPRLRAGRDVLPSGLGDGSSVGVPVVSGAAVTLVPDGVSVGDVGGPTVAHVAVVRVGGVRSWLVGWPAVVPAAVVGAGGVDGSVVGGVRTGGGVSALPAGVDGSVVGGVGVAAAAVVSVRGVSGGVARTPMVVAESVARVVIVGGLHDAYAAAPEVTRMSWVRPAGVDGSAVGAPTVGAAVSAAVDGVSSQSAAGGVVVGDVVLPMVLVVPGVAGGEVAVVEVAATVSVGVAGVDESVVGGPVVVRDEFVLVPGVGSGAVGQVRVVAGSVAVLVDWRIADVVRRWDGALLPRWSGGPVRRWLRR